MRDGEYISIPLYDRHGCIRAHAKVDTIDARLTQHRWRLSNGYVVRDRPAKVYLHREVLGLVRGDGMRADHINRDRLDCRRGNLRLATAAENAQNLSSKGGSSRFRGVHWHKGRRKWVATATVNYKAHYLGIFEREEDAAMAAQRFREIHMPYAVEALS